MTKWQQNAISMLRTIFTVMRLITLFFTFSRKRFILDDSLLFVKRKSYNTFTLVPSLSSFRPNKALYCRRHSSLDNDGEDIQSSKETSKNHKSPKIVFVDENNKEIYMYIHEAEKYARSKNSKLVQLPSNSKKKQKYKLQKVTELFQDKTINTDSKIKKYLVKDVISEHDFQIKINSMIKNVEKGITVLCVVEKVDPVGKLDEMLKLIKNSKLNEYIIQNVKTSKKLTMSFENKPCQTNKSNQNEVKETSQIK